MTSQSRKHNLGRQGLSHFQYGHLLWCTCQGWQVQGRTCRRPACFWNSSWTQVAFPRGKWQLACAQAAELCTLPKEGKQHRNISVFIKSHITGALSAWVKNYTMLQWHHGAGHGFSVHPTTEAPKLKPGASTSTTCPKTNCNVVPSRADSAVHVWKPRKVAGQGGWLG